MTLEQTVHSIERLSRQPMRDGIDALDRLVQIRDRAQEALDLASRKFDLDSVDVYDRRGGH